MKPIRILDPIHGLIDFDSYDFQALLIKIINSRTFQRLRYIHQLGLTDFVYPSAGHTRFSHSLGVAHIAGKIVQRISKQIGSDFDQRLQEQVILAALLHDIGHGPFSHLFERIEQGHHDHEFMGAELLKLDEFVAIFSEFDRLSDLDAIARLWQGLDISSSVLNLSTIISGALDADRLDYLHRDQVMTGSFQGRFDWPWLLDNIVWSDYGLALGGRAVHAVEEYLLARSHMYQTVYFHRTVRGAESMLVRMLQRFRGFCQSGEISSIADISKNHPLLKWYSSIVQQRSLQDFLRLDDMQLRYLYGQLIDCKDSILSNYAHRLQYRQLYHCYEPNMREVEHLLPLLDDATKRQAFEDETGVWVDIVQFTPYDSQQPIYIQQDTDWVNIADISTIAHALQQPKIMLRLYYEDQEKLAKVLSF